MDLTERILKLSPQQRKRFESKLKQQGIDIAKLQETAKTRTVKKQEIQAAEKKEFYPLASAQKRLFMIHHLYDENLVYNMPGIMLLQGEVNRSLFVETLKAIIHRHESLRTSFETIRGEPVHQVHDEVKFEIEYSQSLPGENQRSLSNCQTRGEVSSTIGIQTIIQDFIRPFDLSCAPLLRVGLIKLPHTSSAFRSHPSQEGKENRYLFLVDMHHIISDGLSLNLFIKEFTTLYAGEKLPLLPFQYRDFVQWQDRALMSGHLAKQETYWLEQFPGQLPSLDMPLDFERPPAQSFEGKTIHFTLQGELNQALQALIRQSSTTLFMMLLAVYNCLFYKYTGQEDIIIGTAVAGRNHKGLEKIIGLFMETLVFRCFPQSQLTFAHFLEQVKTTCLNSFENQFYPFRELMKKTVDESDLSHNPLFDAMLILHNLERLELEIEGLRFSPYESDAYPAPVQVDINLLTSEDDTGILFDLSYASALFKRETMERFSRHFVNLVRQVTGNPRMRLKEIDILSQEEKQQVLEQFSSTAFEYKYKYDSRQTLPELLEMPVEKVPDHTALVLESKNSRLNWTITHRHLYQRVRRLARKLKQRGVKPDDIVGIIADPSEDMMVAVMGILNAGAAFLPIDPKMPFARVNYMLRDSSASLLLVSNRTYLSGYDETPGQNVPQQQYQVMEIDGPGVREDDKSGEIGKKKITPTNQSLADSLVYVIYTSGSTGQPKGVPISQKNLLPLLSWFMAYFQLDESSRVLQNLSYSFDFGVFEILTTFGCGGTYFIPDQSDPGDLSAYGDFIPRHCIDTLHTTPTLFKHLVSTVIGSLGLRILHFGGEALSGKLVRDTARLVSRTAVIYNGYGPTEATINTSIFSIKAGDTRELRDSQRIPIGKPSALNSIYILDTTTSSHIQPIGVAGELCIAGQGLSRGYLNNPELTNKKFLQGGPGGTVFSKRVPPGRRRLYQTGDLARWLADGNIEFLGRIDTQVKVRGYRIELGEIENRLSFHKNIERVVVILKSGALCAYFTRRNQEPTAVRELRDFLAEKLPDYMVPAYFIPLDRVPVTSSGKVNLRDLPEPGEHMLETGISHVEPRDEIETQVLTVWQEVLNLENIGITDDFFELGGDSITANQVIARLREEHQVELSIKKFFESPFIEALAKEIKKKERKTGSIVPMSRQGKIPLSFSQERLWFLHQLDNNIISYHVPRTVRIRGKLDVTLLAKTFNEIIRRHEILRTVFPTIDGQPVQQINPPSEIKIPIIDLSSLQLEAQSARVSGITLTESQEPFDLEHGPLLRLTLLKLKPGEYLLLSTEHHFIHDGWAQGILLKEFIAIYSAFSGGKPSPLPELPIQYADFVLWQRNLMQGEVLDSHLAYWRKKLADAPPVMQLPLDHPRPAVISGKGAARTFYLSESLSSTWKTFSKEKKATLFICMLTAFKVLLYRYTGHEDLCVGTGIANRRYKEIETLMGMIINTLPLRTCLQGNLSFQQCLQQVKTTCIEAYEHEDTPFEKIVEALRPERTLSYTPLFQVLFSFMDTPTEHFRLPGLQVNAEPTHNRSSKFDLNIVVLPPPEELAEEIGSQIYIEWEYNTDIFVPATIDRMINHYTRLLELIPKHIEEPICSLPMLEKSELHQLLDVWNDTAVDYPQDKTIHQLFETQVEQTPDHIALSGVHKTHKKHKKKYNRSHMSYMSHLTYKELNKKTIQLAYLLIEKGVHPDTIAGIMLERSIEMAVGVLAILKAGGAYLPISPDYPKERIHYMLADSDANTLVTTENLFKNKMIETRERKTVFLSTAPGNSPIQPSNLPTFYPSNPLNLAYIIYTSGTTGKPKAAMVKHRSVVRLVKNTNYIEFKKDDRILQTGALEFDASTFEIWGSLLNGLQLFLVSNEMILAADKIKNIIQTNRITTMWLTSPLFNQLLDQDIEILRGLKNLLVGGDILSPPHINRLRNQHPELNIINGYGPTENTTFSTTYPIDREYHEQIPIGKPIANSFAYIVSNYGYLQPVGVTGELWIGGHGVARGYLNKPELTSEKFDRDLWNYQDNNRSYTIYKTGDLAKWLADGNIQFLGRTDQQVKIRGFRVELDEIENQLVNHPLIKEAVVIAIRDKTTDKKLSAYIVCTKPIDIKGLRDFLNKVLPEYMIPTFFIILDKIPLTPNGKVDRKALPAPEKITSGAYTAPRNPIEKKLAEIWSTVLGIEKEKIGIDDNFFELGGHSLNAARMISGIHKEMNVKIPLAEVFIQHTIRTLSLYIGQSEETRYAALKPVEKKEYYELSSAQKRLYILQTMDFTGTAYNISQIIPLPGDIDIDRLEPGFKELIQRHESLRTSFLSVNEEPAQRIHDIVDFEIEYHQSLEGKEERFPLNCQGRAGISSPIEIGTIIKDFIRPFDFSHAPLLRVGLIKTVKNEYMLIVDIHHIVTDGTSQDILSKEFMALYSKTNKKLPPLRLQYKDYAGWRNSPGWQESMKQQESYWNRLFSPLDEYPVLNLPLDYPRPLIQSFEGNSIDFPLDEQQTQLLKNMAKKAGATIYMAILSVYTILLSKLSGQEDIIVGTPVAARRHPDLEHIIGMFVNTLAIRDYPSNQATFKEFLKEVKKRTIEAFDNQDYPFENLVDSITVRRDTSRNPIFDVMFNLLNQTEYKGPIPDMNDQNSYLYQDQKDIIRRTSKFDLNLTAIELEDEKRLFFTLEYCTKLFKKSTIQRIIGYFKNILSILSAETDTFETLKLSEIQILSNEEKQKILEMSRGNKEWIEPHQTIHHWFEEQVEQTPDQIAVTAPHQLQLSITYKELNRKSNQLARLMRKKGVKANHMVGLMVDPSVETIIGMLAILKAGGAYLPMEAKLPPKRKKIIIKESAMRLLAVNHPRENLTYLAGESVEIIELTDQRLYTGESSPPENIHKDTNLIYVIYTSGSTGIPKGVMLEHRNLVNLIRYHHKRTQIDCTRVTQFASIGFDASFHEIFSTLLAGGTLFVLEKEEKINIPGLCRIIRENDIKTTFLPISFLKMIFSEEIFAARFPCSLRHIQTAGEQVVIIDRFRQYLKENNVYLHNHYGPSETHVVTALKLEPQGEIPELPSIGKPIDNTGIYILDKALHFKPVGAAGELYVGGMAVGRGYINNPELTAQKFQSNSMFYKSYMSYRTYKTGDLARWLPDGNIQFLGRIDYQVKIRGFRTELGEIESQLVNHPLVKEVVVTALTDDTGDKHLCAYMVCMEPPDITGLREFLAKRLPDYMIPSYFVTLEKIPLTPNKKVDRHALPKPGTKPGSKYVAPRDEVEKKLVELWSEVIGIKNSAVGIDTNFFELGGHSLKATILVSKIHKKLEVKVPLAELFKTPFIRGLAGYIKNLGKDKFISITTVEKKEYYALSSAQKRLYFLQQMDINGTVYNMPLVIPLSREYETEKLENIFKRLIQRHESLRTSLSTVNEEPVQRIHDKVQFEIEYHDMKQAAVKVEEKLSSCSEGTGGLAPLTIEPAARSPQPAADIISSFIRPFDLSKAPLLRAGLIETGEKKQLLFIDMHHIITDGASIEILRKEFFLLYRDESAVLPRLKLQYRDFTRWQNHLLSGPGIKKQEAYWLKVLEGDLPALTLPYDFPRPLVQRFEGNTVNFLLHRQETAELRRLAREESITLYISILSIFTILLSKLSGQEDIIIGMPIAGRRHADLEPIIGMFVNTLPIRNYPRGEKTFIQFLSEVKNDVLEAFENQEYQFEKLVEKVSPTWDTSRNPIFDTAFNLVNQPGDKENARGINKDSENTYLHTAGISKFDMALTCRDRGENIENGLLFTLEYSSRLFKPRTIERFIGYFKTATSIVLTRPRVKLAEIQILNKEERHRVLLEFNQTAAAYPKDKTIHQLFARQVEKTPNQIAVVGPLQLKYRTYISYKELNEKTDQLAETLRGNGVQADTIVGLMAERSIETIIGILGILKAGGAYLPIDPDYPKERINYMLADSSAKILLTRQEIAGLFSPKALNNHPKGTSIHPSTLLPFYPSRSSSLAYILYTSGSTGRPKGVMVQHQNVVRLVKNSNFIDFIPGDRLLLTGALVFDITTFEIWTPLVNGLTLFLTNQQVILDAEKLGNFILKNKISILHLIPQLFNQLAARRIEIFKSLRYFLVGGDLVRPKYINKLRNACKKIKILHMYGPTENTTFSTFHPVNQNYDAVIPIGKPIANSTVYIIDKYHRLVPIGVPGELLVGGDGVARGYLNNPQLTAQKFDHDGYHRSYLSYYRTGDLARWRHDGTIEFLGRIDLQVKIRGMRIELGEIENQLIHHPHIKEAVVITMEDNTAGNRLGAYLVCNNQSPPAGTALKTFLAKSLPHYMIPTFFVTLDRIPLTPNGKIDMHALPTPEITSGKEYAPSRNKTEEKLVEIWSGVLNLKQQSIGINDSFFELGGHSLNATIMAARIHKEFQVKIPLAQIFKTPTIKGISQFIGKTGRSKFISIVPGEKKDYYPLSSSQKQFYVIQQINPGSINYNMPSIQKVEGVVEREKLENAFHRLIQRHETLRTSFIIVNQDARQRVHDRVEFHVQYYDISEVKVDDYEGTRGLAPLSIEPAARSPQPAAAFISSFIRPFDLSKAPLLRVGLFQLEKNSYILMVDMHHILTDFLSQEILIKEFVTLYIDGPLEELKLQYKDYSHWQNRLVLSGKMKKQEEFWLNQFKEGVPAADIPLDFPRPPVRTFAGESLAFELDHQETRELISLASAENVTLFMLFLTVTNVLLHTLSGQEEITVGTVAAGRRHPDLDKIIGAFINTLVLKNTPTPAQTFRQFLRQVKKQTLQAFDNQDFQFEELVQKVKVKREPTRNPLFDVMFSFNPGVQAPDTAREDQAGIHENVPDIRVGPYNQQEGGNAAKFDLILTGTNQGEYCRFIFSYSSEIFKKETMQRYARYFKEIVTAVAADADTLLKHINVATGLQTVVNNAYAKNSEFQF